MVSIPSISMQASYFRYPSPGDLNGVHLCRSSISSVALTRKTVKWKESGRGQEMKAIPSNMMFMEEGHKMKLMGLLRQFGPSDVENARRANKNYSLYRNPRVYCKATTSGDFSGNAPSQVSQYERIIETLTTLFPVWVILGTIIGIYKPAMVTWLETDLFTLGLGFLMLSMGLTLTFDDFRRCLRNPWTVGVGFLAQYFIKPVLGFFIAMALKLSAPLATGLILVSCCPGGQASNVATYISKGNVALSVLMTTITWYQSLCNGLRICPFLLLCPFFDQSMMSNRSLRSISCQPHPLSRTPAVKIVRSESHSPSISCLPLFISDARPVVVPLL